jgi:ribokinase
MTRLDVIGFGALNVDMLFRVDKIANREEESFVCGYQESCGGSAANTIVGLARLGLKTGFVGKVANDREGKLLLDDFSREKVDSQGVVVETKGASGVVMGFVDREGQRALYVAAGVNDTIGLEDIAHDYVGRGRLLHLTSFVGARSFDSQKRLMERLPSDIAVSFDPGMLYARKGLLKLKPIMQRAVAVMPNETELRLITGKGYEEGARSLLAEGPRIVAVKLGAQGCFLTNGHESHLLKPYRVKVVDTTGAGDAWNTGFLYGLLANKKLRECGRLGNFVASRCIMQMGARTGLPRKADLRPFKNAKIASDVYLS